MLKGTRQDKRYKSISHRRSPRVPKDVKNNENIKISGFKPITADQKGGSKTHDTTNTLGSQKESIVTA